MSLILILALSLFAQISPGDLTNAHANLEGMTHCTQCHEIGKKVDNDKCLDCHKEIKTRIEKHVGFHVSDEVKKKSCFECHNEHHGRNFEIVHFDKNKFDHSLTGYILKEKHSSLKCEDCHKQDFISDKELKKKEHTFLGLSQNCTSCHEDFHQGELGNNCASCHTEKSFRPAPGFNHNNSKFILTGAHIKTDCSRCHKSELIEGKKIQHFKGLAFESCTACHDDIHKNKFGQNCTECHTTDSFRQIKDLRKFNHSKTNFALVGQHNTVSCNKCHTSGYTKKLKHEKCSDCHTDYHKDEFNKNKKKHDCKDCHNEFGFTPSLYTIESHNLTDFKLIGGHLAVPCETCHKNNSEWKFRFSSIDCVSCHKNVHGNSISSQFMGNNECTKCHNENSWDKINFDHNTTKFILTGKHLSVSCRSCHIKTTFNGNEVHLFSQLNQKCESCHEDKHAGQFVIGTDTDCFRCHTTSNWKAEKFSHDNTGFKLTGKHQITDCSKCHKTVTSEKGTFVKYKFESFKCADCHL